MSTPLATPDDVADIWPSAATMDDSRLVQLIAKASAKLRKACPFDIDARIALFQAQIPDRTALDPTIVADRVAVIVKRFLINPDGLASSSETVGPFSRSGTFVNRYDKTGADVRGEIRIIEEDIDELRPAVPFVPAGVARVGIPTPQVLIPAGDNYYGVRASYLPAVVPDVTALSTNGECGDSEPRP